MSDAGFDDLMTALRRRAATEGDRTVYTHLVDGERARIELTFAGLWRRACAIAAELERAGLAGERALLLYPPGLDYAPALFGCFLAGVVAVPEGPPDPRRPERSLPRIRAVSANARAEAVLTVEPLLGIREKMPDAVAGARWIATDRIADTAPLDGALPHCAQPAPDALAYLQYTSGSTADPKGVMLTHRHLAANCRAIVETYRPDADSVMVSWVPTFHDLGLVYGVAMPVYSGFHGVSLAAADFARRPIRWLRAIHHFGGTHSIAPDVAYAITALKSRPDEREGLDLSTWTMALNGAEPVRATTERRFVEAFAPHGFRAEAFSHSWGLSEATAELTGERDGARMQFLDLDADALGAHRVRRAEASTARVLQLASCGTPAAGATLVIVDPETRARLPADHIGEVWVSGPSVGLGYWEAPQATAETFGAYTADGEGPFLRTGDRGFLDDGRLFVAGRIKELLIIRGQNHYPQDLEASVAGRHRALRPGGAVAFSVERPDGEQVAVVAEVRPDRIDDPEAVYGAIRAGLAEHGLRPARITLVPPGGVPRTTSGKLQRRKTRALLLDGRLTALHDWTASEAPTAAPRPEPAPAVDVERIRAVVAEVLGVAVSAVPPRRPLAELGFDSASLAELAERLQIALARPVATPLLFDHPTPAALAEALGGGADATSDGMPDGMPDGIRGAGGAIGDDSDAIVIVSMASRLPGADDPDALWDVLRDGIDAIGDFPTDRGWPADLYAPDPDAVGHTYAPGGGFVDGVADFDAAHFGITPREALVMDPQQRLLLELAWHALEWAGLDPDAMHGEPVGTYVGLCQSDYARLVPPPEAAADGLGVLGSTFSVASGRLAYAFGFTGPAISIDTACSASLVAVHQAAHALRRGECDLALAGGATVHATPEAFITFSRMRALSPTGRSKAFSDDADGAGWAEGAGLILLTRLSEARRRGLPIRAVLRGSAIDQDGRSQGLTAPNGPAQVRVIRRALASAGLEPHEVDVVEAHGTGTRLGDPIEAGALLTAYGDRPAERPLWLGAIKSNLGHTQAAAGVAGVIKTILALQHGLWPRSLHVRRPAAPLTVDGPVRVATEPVPWPVGERPRRAAVSSFGISGTNAHLILEEAPQVAEPAGVSAPWSPCPVMLSARSAEGLSRTARRWAQWLRTHPSIDVPVLARGAAHRAGGRWRAAITADDVPGVLRALDALADGQPDPALDRGQAAEIDGVVFVVPGQGGQWVGMGRPLIASVPAFAEAIDACDAALAPETGWSVRAALCADAGAYPFDREDIVQPCLFAMAVSLAAAWRALGVVPTAVIGHSQGEIAAAVIAGHLSLIDGARVIARRSAIIEQRAPAGAMAIVDLDADTVGAELAAVGEGVSVAVVNGPSSTAISGDTEAIARQVRRFAARGKKARAIKIGYASHSPHMDPILPAVAEALVDISPRKGPVPMISTVTGAPIAGDALDAGYWCRNLRSPVRFDRALAAVEGRPVFIELGAHPVLLLPLSEAVDGRAVGSLRRDAADARDLARALPRLHIAGLPVDWRRILGAGPRAALPGLSFDRRRFWAGDGARPSPRPTEATAMQTEKTADALRSAVAAAVGQVIGTPASALDPEADLMGLGIDSMMVMQIKKALNERFAVDVPNALFFEAGTSVARLTAYVDARRPAPIGAPSPAPQSTAPPSTADVEPLPEAASGDIARIMQQQLDALADLSRRQLETLQRLGRAPSSGAQSRPQPAPRPAAPASPPPPASEGAGRDVFVPFRPIVREGERADHLGEIVERYTAATPTSKARTDADRFVFANNRNIAGFTPATKEMTYQIIAERAQGAHVWDLDGNRFVDITMGFGSCMLGHDNPLVADAIRAQMSRSWAVGPIADPAAGVARRLSALTGLERVAFYNSGTEAVMVALRLARTATGRPKVVVFEGSYHGMFESVLALRSPHAGVDATPMAPGVPESMVADTIVLPYADEAVFAAIEARDDIAAVLVESVQSRRPDVQPRNFLHRLRAVCDRIGAALIFDEVVTGFRIGPDGAQGYFGVKADIATYGKVVGGGMPVGIVAGSARFLDGVDGGMWRFGDDSMPEKTNTFVAGTFCSHPLSMAASRAVLDHLAEQGPLLQVQLDARTRSLCARLNTVFADARLPIHVVQFGSLFRYVVPRAYELLYYRLIAEGIYIWEGRNCFLSTAHSDADLDAIVAATRSAAAWLVEAVRPGAIPARFGVLRMPATAAQRAMYARCTRPAGERGYHLPVALRVKGPLRVATLAESVGTLVHRHPALRTAFVVDDEGTLWQRVHPVGDWAFEATDRPAEADDVEGWLDGFVDHVCRPFDLERPGLLRCGVARIADDDHLVVLDVHHLVCDGVSIDHLIETLWALYAGGAPPLPAADYADFVAWEKAYLAGPRREQDAAFWAAKAGPSMALPADRDEAERAFEGALFEFGLPADDLRAFARARGVTLHILLAAIFRVFCRAVSGQDDVCFGSPTAGRPEGRFAETVGLFIGTLVHRARIGAEERFADVLAETRADVLAMLDAQHHPFERTAAALGATPARPPFEVGFSFEASPGRSARAVDARGHHLQVTLRPVPPRGISMDVVLEILDDGAALHLRFAYNPRRYDRETVAGWSTRFRRLTAALLASPDAPLADLPPPDNHLEEPKT